MLVIYKTFLKWQVRDLLRRRGMSLLSLGRLLQYALLRLLRNPINLRYLMDAHRYYQTKYLTNFVCSKKQLIAGEIDFFIDNVQLDQINLTARRTIILKKPAIQNGWIEKGVLLIAFTESFPFFHNHVDCEKLLKYFYIVLEPSSAGYCDPNILFWMKYKSYPIVVQATEEKDYRFLLLLKSNLIPVPFGASDWVDFRIFRPIPGMMKRYASIYVSSYNYVKRHHLLFKTIREIRDPNYKCALVFGKSGNAKCEIEQLIDYYQVRNNVTIYYGVPQRQVNEILNMSKVNILLSLKEGSNRSIFEGLFANVPGIVLKNNLGVKKDYINETTGRLIDERRLKDTLLYFRNHWEKYNPREWALKNISPLVTAKKLSKYLKIIAQDKGEPWTKDIIPKVNAPELKYFYPEDELSMPTSRAVISLFLKTNVGKLEKGQILQGSLGELCTIID